MSLKKSTLSPVQKRTFLAMLKRPDMYIEKRRNAKGEGQYKLYQGKCDPVSWLTDRTMDFRLRGLLKRSHPGRYTLNLRIIRKHDGRSWIKKQYRLIKKKKSAPLQNNYELIHAAEL